MFAVRERNAERMRHEREIALYKLAADESILVVVDVQERLAAAMSDRESVIGNIEHLGVLAKDLAIPHVVTEQYPRGLGPTVERLRMLFDAPPIEKLTFSCFGEAAFYDRLKASGRTKVVVTGMETHVCVLQTVLDLLGHGFIVHVPADAVCSRSREHRDLALENLRDTGAVITVTETVLFQWLQRAGTEQFKKISQRIR